MSDQKQHNGAAATCDIESYLSAQAVGTLARLGQGGQLQECRLPSGRSHLHVAVCRQRAGVARVVLIQVR